MRQAIPFALLLLACDGKGRELQGSYSASAFLTVLNHRSTAGGVVETSCAGSLSIDSQVGEAIRGSFDRRGCTGFVQAADVHGTFYGSVLPDGTASLTFTEQPLGTGVVFSSAGGCPSVPDTFGPYGGRITKASISLETPVFYVSCCCASRPAPGGGVMVGPPPGYSAQYRIEATR